MKKEYQTSGTKQAISTHNSTFFQQVSRNSSTREQIYKLLQYIKSVSYKSGVCFAYNSRFAREVGISERTARRYLRKVENLGLVKIDIDMQRKYWRHITLTSKGNQALTKKVVHSSPEVVHNNINNEFNIYNITTKQVQLPTATEEPKEQETISEPVVASSKKEEQNFDNLMAMIAFCESLAKCAYEEGNRLRKENGSYDECRKADSTYTMYLQKGLELKAKRDRERSQKMYTNSPNLSHSQKRCIQTLCLKLGLDFNIICAQVIYSITKGSLSICNKTKRRMEFGMGFNIACKLIREKRWTVPVGFVSC